MKFKCLLLSVRNEPFFRGSNLSELKYVKRLGNTPGRHLSNFHYFRFRSLVNKYFPKDKVGFRFCRIWNFFFIKRSQ